MRLSLLFLISIVYLFSIPPCYAQYQPQYSQYWLNNYLINPAITGIENYADVQIGYRQQWLNVEGAPRTLHVTMHTPLGQGYASSSLNPVERSSPSYRNDYFRAKPHHGVGGQAHVDEIGPFRRNEVALSYAYHVPVSPTVQLSAGVQAGWIQHRLAADQIILTDPNDQAIYQARHRYGQPSLSVGIWAYSSTAYVGASVYTALPANQFLGIDTNASSWHGYLTAAYRYEVGPSWSVQPSLLLRLRSPESLSYDVGVRALWSDRIWIGGAYRASQEWIAIVGVHISSLFSVAYSYDIGGGYPGPFGSGSHEVVLNLRIFNQQKVLCPQQMW